MASHQLVSITSLPFVHTARRFYRSNRSMRTRDGVGLRSFGGFSLRAPGAFAGTCSNLAV